MEYGRLVVLGYSSYRVDTVRRPRGGSTELTPSFGLSEASSSSSGAGTDRDELGVARSSPSSASSKLNRKKALGQFWKPLGDQNAQYILERRPHANGMRLQRFHHVAPVVDAKKKEPSAGKGSSKDLKAVTTRIMQRITEAGSASDISTEAHEQEAADKTPFLMCVPMNDQDAFANVTEFHTDPTTDLFQIGRMPCHHNDFVIPGPRVGASGTISRYAARILCSREPPFECRLFAGGFDAARRMTTAGHALKHCVRCGEWFKRVARDHVCVAHELVERQLCQESDESARKGASNASDAENQSEAGVTRQCVVTRQDGTLEYLQMPVSSASELPMDGLTKNGVRIWIPERKQWFEVSVNGSLYAIEARTAANATSVSVPRPGGSHQLSSSAPSRTSGSHQHHRNHSHDGSTRTHKGAFNRPSTGAENLAPILTDGAIIDLGGVQLQYQTSYRPEAAALGMAAVGDSDGLLEAPVVYGRTTLSSVGTQLERLNVQCPVQLHALRFTSAAPGEEVSLGQIPHVFPACGHVFGFEKRIASSHTCPLCRKPGSMVKLLLKENSQLQSAEEQHAIPECVLNPCGHAISSKLARHYATLLMPNGRAICPFCAVHLDPRVPFSRLFLYSDAED